MAAAAVLRLARRPAGIGATVSTLKDMVRFGAAAAEFGVDLAREVGTGIKGVVRAATRDALKAVREREPMAQDAITPRPEDQPGSDKSASAADDDLPKVIPNVPQAVGGGFPEPPGRDPNDLSKHDEPHHVLNTPVEEILDAAPGDLDY